MSKGIVKSLLIKQQHQQPMSISSQIQLAAGVGIIGDINSDRHSPRQILVINRQDLNQLSIPPGELRENIVLEGINAQHFQPGAKLIFASGAEIRLTFYCEPCKRVSHLVDSLKDIEGKRGILGIAIKSGEISVSNDVVVIPNYFPALSEIPYERFLSLVNKIPSGKVITYKEILKGIGVDRSYYRVMPMYLKKAPSNYPIHRVLDSQGKTISHIPQHYEKLVAEGIQIKHNNAHLTTRGGAVSLKEYLWQDFSLC